MLVALRADEIDPGGAKAAQIYKLLVPWLETSDALPDPSADRVYFTYLGGVAESSTRVAPYSAGQGFDYPGTAFSPLVIIADVLWPLR